MRALRRAARLCKAGNYSLILRLIAAGPVEIADEPGPTSPRAPGSALGAGIDESEARP